MMLHRSPTVTSSHPIVSLAAPADPPVAALTDPDIRDFAWSEHGFRGKLGGSVAGMSQTVSSLVPMPDAPTVPALIQRLGTPS